MRAGAAYGRGLVRGRLRDGRVTDSRINRVEAAPPIKSRVKRADACTMKPCGKCGANVGDGAIKCPHCRTLLVAPPPGVGSTAAASSASAPSYVTVPPSPAPPSYAHQWSAPPGAPPIGMPYMASRTRWTWKRLIKLVVVAVVAIFAFGAAARVGLRVVSDAATEQSFMDGCTTGGGSKPKCHCMWDYIDGNVPIDDVKQFDREVQTPGWTPEQAPQWVRDAVGACAGVA